MCTLKNILLYYIDKYPFSEELSNARLTKMVYLTDWLNCVKHEVQATDIKWYYDNFGPYVTDIIDFVREDSDFKIENSVNYYGNPKTIIRSSKKVSEKKLNPELKKIMDHVIEKTKSLTWDSFIKLVYSTYPIVASEKYNSIDLVKLAKEYKEIH